jgi:exoribonuclease R
MTTWLAGILEVTSKVRYGLTSRGSPLYKFVPYDKRFSPLAVGSSIRDFSTNLHVVVEPSKQGKPGQMNHGNLVKSLGPPTPESEQEVLLNTYAYNNRKDLRKEVIDSLERTPDFRYEVKEGFTFHIDPEGCMDVDDAFTFIKTPVGWRVMIHITDVDYWIDLSSPVDILAKERSTSFYCPNGNALAPMLPLIYSGKEASLLPGSWKPAVSLVFDWIPGKPLLNTEWLLTRIEVQHTFTYETAMKCRADEMKALREIAIQLGGDTDSHSWVQELMILYNEQAALLLRENKRGVLRRHSAPKEERLREFALLQEKEFEFLCMEAAEYCLATDENAYHYGLRKTVYSYASSPLRRYADLSNQRILKEILKNKNTIPNPSQEDVDYLNMRNKQAKDFSRDIFFMRMLTESKNGSVNGYVLQVSDANANAKAKVWVPEWKRMITLDDTLEKKKWYVISWYKNMEIAGWKQRVVYSTKLLDDRFEGA